MRKIQSLVLAGLFVVVYAATCLGIDKEAGTSGAVFLKIGGDARLKAMGSAGSALSGGAGLVLSNPASIANLSKKEAALTYLSYFQGISLGQLGYAQDFGFGNLGANITYLSHDDIRGYDDSGNYKGDYSANNLALVFSYAREVKDFALGANLKYVKEEIEQEDAACLGLDLGGIYKTKYKDLHISSVVQNLGGKVRLKKEGDPLPLNFKLGTSYKYLLKNRPLSLVLDINFPRDNKINYSLGTEYLINKVLAIRAGYCLLKDSEAEGLTCGIGFRFKELSLDYAWQPFGDLGDAHWFSFKIKM